MAARVIFLSWFPPDTPSFQNPNTIFFQQVKEKVVKIPVVLDKEKSKSLEFEDKLEP